MIGSFFEVVEDGSVDKKNGSGGMGNALLFPISAASHATVLLVQSSPFFMFFSITFALLVTTFVCHASLLPSLPYRSGHVGGHFCLKRGGVGRSREIEMSGVEELQKGK